MTKLNIQEANSHLRQLHKKVYELETKVHMQNLHIEELEASNLQLKQQLKKNQEESSATLTERDGTASELKKNLEESELHVQSLLKAAEERDKLVEKLEKKARLFYEVVEHRATLAHMVEVLDELSVTDELHGNESCGGVDRDGPTSNCSGIEEGITREEAKDSTSSEANDIL